VGDRERERDRENENINIKIFTALYGGFTGK
jgi:hypothetical protein